MKFLKIFFTFLFSFTIAYLVLTNLSLPQFKQPVSIKIFSYNIPEFPVYLYVVGSFFFGLFIGLIVAVYNYFSLNTKVHSYKKKINHLENEVSILNNEIDKQKAELDTYKNKLVVDNFEKQKESDSFDEFASDSEIENEDNESTNKDILD